MGTPSSIAVVGLRGSSENPPGVTTGSSCDGDTVQLLVRVVVVVVLCGGAGRSGHLQGGVSPPRNGNILYILLQYIDDMLPDISS